MTSASLPTVTQEERAAIRDGPRDVATHAQLLAALPFANALDVASAPSRTAERDAAVVVAWNAERCKFLDESAAFLAAQGADVLLLSELDWGMARSGQHHCARELASRLGCAYAYGVEFLELDEPSRSEGGERARGERSEPSRSEGGERARGERSRSEPGGERERAEFCGQGNAVGYHGNAILARGALARPQLVRLETRGDWFDGARGEARVGGRCAVLAQLRVEGRATTFAAVHLDSHGSPENRAAEMRVLLAAIDAYDRAAPVVIGGDLNAFSLGLADLADPARVAAALRDDPLRWSHPVPHEPLFAIAAECGYEWSSCNALRESTLRHATEAGSARGKLKLDWFLCRGIAASAPRVVAAVGPAAGGMLSDHEAIGVALGL